MGKPCGRSTITSSIKRCPSKGGSYPSLIEKETQAWISEFQSNLTQLEKETKEALDAAREQARKGADAVEKARGEAGDAQRQGAINLTIKATSVEGGFKVEVDGRVYRDGVTGMTCGIINIPPGLHEVGVSGKGGYASKVVTVKGNTVEPVEIEVK